MLAPLVMADGVRFRGGELLTIIGEALPADGTSQRLGCLEPDTGDPVDLRIRH